MSVILTNCRCILFHHIVDKFFLSVDTQAVRHSTVELLRRRQAGKPLEDDPDKEKIARGKMTWPGLQNY